MVISQISRSFSQNIGVTETIHQSKEFHKLISPDKEKGNAIT